MAQNGTNITLEQAMSLLSKHSDAEKIGLLYVSVNNLSKCVGDLKETISCVRRDSEQNLKNQQVQCRREFVTRRWLREKKILIIGIALGICIMTGGMGAVASKVISAIFG
jgi:hypothetical protein